MKTFRVYKVSTIPLSKQKERTFCVFPHYQLLREVPKLNGLKLFVTSSFLPWLISSSPGHDILDSLSVNTCYVSTTAIVLLCVVITISKPIHGPLGLF